MVRQSPKNSWLSFRQWTATREKEWVLAASASLVGNKIIQELDLVGLSFEDLDGLEAADAGQKSWLKRCSVSEYRLPCLE